MQVSMSAPLVNRAVNGSGGMERDGDIILGGSVGEISLVGDATHIV